MDQAIAVATRVVVAVPQVVAGFDSLDEVVKCTVFLADIAEWPAMNEVYISYFTKHKPARSAVAGSGLALDSRVEIECMATVGL